MTTAKFSYLFNKPTTCTRNVKKARFHRKKQEPTGSYLFFDDWRQQFLVGRRLMSLRTLRAKSLVEFHSLVAQFVMQLGYFGHERFFAFSELARHAGNVLLQIVQLLLLILQIILNIRNLVAIGPTMPRHLYHLRHYCRQ